jgi:hypothetical protein
MSLERGIRLRRPLNTLVIALKWLAAEGESIVIGSDSRAIYGPVAYEVKKIYPIYLTLMANK